MKLSQKLFAEFLGTAGLLMVVVGSGIMGESLSHDNMAIALLANSIATGAGLFALIQSFAHISGSHFNPAVSLIEYLRQRLTLKELYLYSLAQFTGALVGVFLTHIMFGQILFQLSQHDRGEMRFYFSEFIATFGLLLVIALSGQKNPEKTPVSVALYITSAYWFTSSTSFANPAVTIARSLTNTFSGILWTNTFGFITAQILAVLITYKVIRFF